VIDHRAEELGHQAGVESRDRFAYGAALIGEEGPPAEVERYQYQRFIHGYQHASVPVYASFVAQGLGEGHTQADAHVLDGMVAASVQIALGLHGQIERPWPARSSSMWSKNPSPVAMEALPEPSRSSLTTTLVSRVLRSIVAFRLPASGALGGISAALSPPWSRFRLGLVFGG